MSAGSDSTAPGPTTGPIRDRLDAWLLGAAERSMHRTYGRRKEELFADLPAELVEIGPAPVRTSATTRRALVVR